MKKRFIVLIICLAAVLGLVCTSVFGEGQTEDTEEGDLSLYTAEQVINGSAIIYAYQKAEEDEEQKYEDLKYKLTVTDAPTNTKISLDSTSLSLTEKDEDGNYTKSVDAVLSGNISYVDGEGSETPVAYLMLDGWPTESDFVIIVYDAEGNPLNAEIDEDGNVTSMSQDGKLIIDVVELVVAADAGHIGKIQTNTLCWLDDSGIYQQTIIEAAEIYEPIIYVLDEVDEETEVNLADFALEYSDDLTKDTIGEFYYGTISGTPDLTLCTTGVVKDGIVWPLDENRIAVEADIYLVNDYLYSFDVEVTDYVDEHTEDNGDTYLWLGNTFYIDQYHNQGSGLAPYCRNQEEIKNCGVWVQLGRLREEAINSGSADFSDYRTVGYENIKDIVDWTGSYTKNITEEDEIEKSFGIVGPFSFTNCETDPITTTKRVTGHVGDRISALDAFGSETVYIIRGDQELHTDWINLGCHASDNGTRAWFYWISDYYLLNNYQDEVEYVAIKNDKDGQVRLYADEMGTTGAGAEYDVWQLTALCTKRNSEVISYMQENQEDLERLGVGFASTLGGTSHIQLRMNTTVETLINGIVYQGTLTVIAPDEVDQEDEDQIAPKLEYRINADDTDGKLQSISGTYKFSLDNDQETVRFAFTDEDGEQFYICARDAFDPQKVQLTVTIYAKGTLAGSDGSVIVYTEEDPLEYTVTLTEELLREAYDCCPNSEGYDVAINLSEAAKIASEDTLDIVKYWDDESNAYHSRDDVTEVRVTLEHSSDGGETWSAVTDSSGKVLVFTISGDPDHNVWVRSLNGGDLDITYTYKDEEGNDQEGIYDFRISYEYALEGASEDYSYVYTTGTDDAGRLAVTNTLAVPISITVEKEWEDLQGYPLDEENIPDSIYIAVLKDGEFYEYTELSAKNNWTHTFTGLPQLSGDAAYKYTIVELRENGEMVTDGQYILLDDSIYHVSINNENYTLTNAYVPMKDVDIDPTDEQSYGDDGVGIHLGDTLTYKIEYYNYNDETAEVTITDKLDDGLTYVENSASNGGTYDADTHTITWTISDVAPHTEGNVTFRATVNENALVRNDVTNTASVKIGGNEELVTNTVYNPLLLKDVDADGDGNYGDSGMQVSVGATLTYQVEYYNDHDEAESVVITDTLDEGLDYVEGSASDGGTYNETTRTITWIISDVEPHFGAFVTFKAVVNETALVKNEVENTAGIQVGDDPVIESNTVYNPVPQKDVDADGNGRYGDSGMQVSVGDTLTYQIEYFNGYDTASTVTITDVLDVGLDFVSADNGGTYDSETRTVTWVIRGVTAQTGGSVTFQATVNENAVTKTEVDNTASVQVGNHSAVDTNTVYNPVPHKNVDVDQEEEATYGDGGRQVSVGDTLTYQIEYFNGYDTAATVTIRDVLDEGLDFEEASDGGTYDPVTRTVTWIIEGVEAHTAGSVTFKATVNETALIYNEVENKASVQVGDGNAADTNTETNPVPGKDVDADQDGTYGDSGVQLAVGDTITYKIDYRNGYDETVAVTITDKLDEGLDYVEGSASDGGVYEAETRTITWIIENVGPYESGSVTFSATINATAMADHMVENSAGVRIKNDPEVETNRVVNPVPDKRVDADGDEEFSDNGLGVKVGDTLTYRVYYLSQDTEPVTVTITDALDEGLDYVEDSASDGGTYDPYTRTITWVIENVEPNVLGYVSFAAIVNETALVRNEVDNTATVQVGTREAVDTNQVSNPVDHKDVDADEDGTYGDSGMQVQVGDTLTYQIDYQNGDDETAVVTITDTLDPGLDFVKASEGGTYNETTRTITWIISGVEAHEGGSVTFQATVNETALEKNVVENTASVQVGDHPAVSTNTVYNPVPGKDVDSDGDGNYGDSGAEASVGDVLTYQIDYFNGYEVPATVTITDTLDIGLTFIEASDGGVYDKTTRTITWNLGETAPLTGGNVTFTARINSDALVKNEVDNTAAVQIGDADEVETNPVYTPVSDKKVDADADGDYGDSGQSVQVGDILTYLVEYFNENDTAVTVTITDTLDNGLTFIEASDGGTYDEKTRTITWVIQNVEPMNGVSVTFTAVVNENAQAEQGVNNTALIQPQNEESYETSTVYNPVPVKDVDADEDTEYGDSGMLVGVGGTLTYQISYENGYDEEMTVVITDILEEGLDYVEGSASDGGIYDAGTRTITWIISGVEAHEGGSVTFRATVNEKALEKNEVENTASVQVGDDPAVSTNTVVNPVPEKDVDADGDGEYGDSGMEASVGDTLTYVIEYQNGYDTAATVIITDVLDSGLDFVSADSGGTYDAETRTITWIIENAAPHTEGSVSFAVTVNSSALEKNEVDNTASVQIGDDPAVDTNPVENPVTDKKVDADGDGTYGDSGLGVQVGDILTYAIEFFNETEESVTVTITDVLDEGLTFVSADNGGTYDEATRTITWIIEDVGPGTGVSVSFRAAVNENALVKNEVANTAVIQPGDDPESSYSTNTVYNPVPEKDVDADGDGTYGDNNMQVSVGSILTYQITYENCDEETAAVTITDVLDEGLDFVSASDSGVYDENTRTITWVIENAEPHTSGYVTFTAKVNETALEKNEVENTASVQVGDHPAARTNTVVNPVPGKDVDADGDGAYGDSGVQVKVGDTLTYVITYQNSSDTAATVTITDVLDPGLDFVSADNGGTYDEATRTITWTIENVDSHTGGSVGFTAAVNETARVEQGVNNTASVKINNESEVSTNPVYNPVSTKDVDADGDGVYGDNGMGVQVGSTLTYLIEYYNDSEQSVTVTITDVLDPGLDFVSAANGGIYDRDTRTITWIVENVEPGASGTVTFQALVNENALEKNEVENTAKVQIGNEPAVNTNTVYNPVPHKDVDVHGNGTYGDSGRDVYVGDSLTYEITYENPNDTPATVTITDVLDKGLNYVSSDPQASYDSGTRTVTWVIENVDAHTSGSVTVTVTVSSSAMSSQVVKNTAVVQVGNQPGTDTETVENPVKEEDPPEDLTPGEETVHVGGIKIWDDGDDADGIRPEEITIRLYADGVEIDSRVVSADENWSWRFSYLPKYDASGNEIRYTIREDAVDGYSTEVNGYDVTNTHIPENEPEEPLTPDSSEEPGSPGNPENPNNPEYPGHSGNPDNPMSSESLYETSAEVETEKATLPQTGDKVNMRLWITVILVAGFITVGLGIYETVLSYVRENRRREW